MTTGYTKTKGPGRTAAPGSGSPGGTRAAGRRSPTPPMALLSAVSHTRDSEAASGSAGGPVCAATEGLVDNSTVVLLGPRLSLGHGSLHTRAELGIRTEKGKGAPQLAARRGPSSPSVGAQLLPAHRRLPFQNRPARPLKAVNLCFQKKTR